jgi:hypothetical protein
MIKVWTDAGEAGILGRREAAIADSSEGVARLHYAHAEFIEIGDSYAPAIGEQGVALSLNVA